MIIIKSEREIEIMKEAGRITHVALMETAKHIKPGVSTYDLDKIAEQTILKMGATPGFKGYQGFPGSICSSVNEEILHGIPSKKKILKNGDILKIDIGAYYRGYHGDCARTFVVGTTTKENEDLIKVCEESFWVGAREVKPGARLSNIGHAIEEFVLSHGYSLIKEYTGHGVGQALHEDPSIPNYGKPNEGPVLKEGMVLAIEPMIATKSNRILLDRDDWTVRMADKGIGAHYENTLAITKVGFIILTTGGEEVVKK